MTSNAKEQRHTSVENVLKLFKLQFSLCISFPLVRINPFIGFHALSSLYCHAEDGKPGDIILTQIKDASSSVSVTMLGVEGTLASHQAADGFHITVPPLDGTRLQCQHAWVFKFSLS